jgi:hypothetical protein
MQTDHIPFGINRIGGSVFILDASFQPRLTLRVYAQYVCYQILTRTGRETQARVQFSVVLESCRILRRGAQNHGKTKEN